MSERRLVLWVGCGNASGDLFVFAVDARSGALTALPGAAGVNAAGSSTSYPLVHPSGRVLYVTNNRSDRLTAFTVDPQSGALERLDEAPVAGAPGSASAGPTYLATSPDGRFLLAANYRGHNVVVRALEPDGRFGPEVCEVRPGQHAHCVRFDPTGRFVYVPCLGSDLVARYAFDSAIGRLTPLAPAALARPAGEGPRHLLFHPNGRLALLVGETGSTLAALSFDAATGALEPQQTVCTVRPGYEGRRWSSDLALAPSGRFVYVANRAEETLAVFSVDDAGALAHVEHVALPGRTPRFLSLDPEGRLLFVAEQDSNDVALFAVDGSTGRLRLAAVTALPASPYFALVYALPG